MLPKNILIYTNPRTGSSTFYNCIADVRSEPVYDELFFDGNVDTELDHYNFLANSDKPVTLKLMHSHIDAFLKDGKLDRFKAILELRDFYIIRLTRENLKDQIFSLAIALKTNQFSHQTKHKIVCDHKTFKRAFEYIVKCNNEIKENIHNLNIAQNITYNDVINDNIVICGTKINLIKYEKLISPPKNNKVKNLDKMEIWYQELMAGVK